MNVLKTIHLRQPETFVNEAKKLGAIPSHQPYSNISSLAGAVGAGPGEIDGSLLPFIPGTSLAKVNRASTGQKSKWKGQIAVP